MINIRTEYSFRKVYGHIDKVVQHCATIGLKCATIADYDNTYGHVQWNKSCRKNGIKPSFGVTFRVYSELIDERKADNFWWVFIAKNNDGLKELYDLVAKAYSQFYYVPRLCTADVLSLSGNIFAVKELDLMAPNNQHLKSHAPYVGFDNVYPAIGDRGIYELIAEYPDIRTTPQHILSKKEWLQLYPTKEKVWKETQEMLLNFTAELIPAPMIRYPGKFNLHDMCIIGAQIRKIDLSDIIYKERMEYELRLIKEKDFEDYFMIVADMINYAKEHMLVGPSRGSSAGSLVCYLLGITEIDPIPFGLIFERFIDITRLDLPDIDIDFPDNKRHMVIEYMENKYGKDHVAHIGTVSRLKAKSAIGEFAQAFGIPEYEVKEVKDSIIERSGGDARAAMCIKDTLETTEVGKNFINKYPQMALVEYAENHARHSGVHAAGLIVSNEPITRYVGFNTRDNVAMIDKYDAEKLNLLKIDALGLRTLTLLEDILNGIGRSYNWLYTLPLDDKDTFNIFNGMRLAGIFQFEGYALQSLTRQMKVEEFNDIVAITSLARPGPLHCGGATDFIERRTNRKAVEYMHDSVIPYTKETYGTVVYQEQVLQISREVGKLSWEDTNQLRRALSKSLGEEFFNKYKVKFIAGAAENNVPEKEADKIWSNMCTFGSWAFNKSHAVSYGLISYWTAYLKAHYPLEFAVATLNNVRDEEQGVKVLRDFVKNEGFVYKTIDPEYSIDKWSVRDGILIGGLTNVKGIGAKKAQQIISMRKSGKPYTPAIKKMLGNPVTPYSDLFPIATRFSDYYADPKKYNINSGSLSYMKDIQKDGDYIFIGKLVDRNLRDLNEYGNLVKRGGKVVERDNLFLNLTLEDDTDSIICTIDRFKYQQYGKNIAESGKIGEDFYLVKGIIKNGWRKIYIEKIKRLN